MGRQYKLRREFIRGQAFSMVYRLNRDAAHINAEAALEKQARSEEDGVSSHLKR